MIIRNKHKSRFTQIPNAIFEDQRISIGAKGLLVYLLSRPPNWSVQHKQLQRALGIGRKLLTKLLNELAEAGYVDRDENQGRDELNLFYALRLHRARHPRTSCHRCTCGAAPPAAAQKGHR